MCGLAGFVDRGLLRDDPRRVLASMADAIRHRGPDDEGSWWSPEARVGLGFRRLSIQDLSPLGHQPMASASGRFVIAFNGEVYNFRDLRGGLEAKGHRFRGHSDTEVMLAAFEEWGVAGAVARFVGMFAFAVWDEREQELLLVRDRLGVKPLYYGIASRAGRAATSPRLEVAEGEALVFASELKAIRRFPGARLDLDRGAAALYARHGYVPGPWSIHSALRKLPPGHLLRWRRSTGGAALERYWSAKEVVERGLAEPFRGTEEEAIEALAARLDDAVRIRMIADVPLGAWLSGGIDSTAVAATMVRLSDQPVRTFTIGFRDFGFDEAPAAAAVARHLGTAHHEEYLRPEAALALVPDLPRIWDEPFADSSQLPTLLVSIASRREVTVILSGDGGDEMFGGYERYRWTQAAWAALSRLPAPARRAAAGMLRAVPRGVLDRVLGPITRRLPARWATGAPGDRLHKLAERASVDDAWQLYRGLVSVASRPGELLVDANEPEHPLTDPQWVMEEGDLDLRMMQADVVTYLVDDILVKVDRATMSQSLEARNPLLDHRLVEFAFTLPLVMKIRGGVSKWALRQLAFRRVPRELLERPKMGFGVPVDRWMRGPLREWAESLLERRELESVGVFRPEAVERIWREHLEGRTSHAPQLWMVLMLQAWARCWSREG